MDCRDQRNHATLVLREAAAILGVPLSWGVGCQSWGGRSGFAGIGRCRKKNRGRSED